MGTLAPCPCGKTPTKLHIANEVSERVGFPDRIELTTAEQRIAAFNRTYDENARRRGQYE